MSERLKLVLAAVPADPVADPADLSGEWLPAWVRREVAVWPAPIPLGRDRPQLGAGTVTFASARPPYSCTFGADGSSILALPVGSLRESPTDGEPVSAIGEGAVAWISVAGLRLAAAFAGRVGARGRALVEATVAGGEAPYEVWNREAERFGPVGARINAVRPVRGVVDLVACLDAGLPSVARPFVLGLLRQFGLSESRHIDAGGVLRREKFTGYDQQISDWAGAIGVPSA